MFLRHAACWAVIGLLCATSAHADEPKPGSVHVGLAFGKAHVANLPSSVYDDVVLNLSVGYTFNGSFAVEVFEQAFLTGPLGGALSSAISSAFSIPVNGSEVPDRHRGIAAVGGLQLADSLRLLGRVGVGRTRIAVYAPPNGAFLRTENRTDPSLGAGLAWDTSARWSLSLNATRYTKTKTTTTTVGAQFRF